MIYREVEYEVWIYYQHPEAKLCNFQNPSLLEVIARPIPGLQYGDALAVWVNADEIEVIKG